MNKMISISMSNTKMGMVPSFSLPPVTTCNGLAPCTKHGCYIKKLIACRPALRKAYERNFSIVNGRGGCAELVRQLGLWLAMYTPTAFRFHVSGDFYSVQYLDACVTIAIRNPKVKFFSFTKQYDVIRKWMSLNGRFPRNFTIILSAWTNFDPPADLMKEFPVAWVSKNADPKKFLTAWNKGKVGMCPGRCDECGKCFNRKRKDGDVLFLYH